MLMGLSAVPSFLPPDVGRVISGPKGNGGRRKGETKGGGGKHQKLPTHSTVSAGEGETEEEVTFLVLAPSHFFSFFFRQREQIFLHLPLSPRQTPPPLLIGTREEMGKREQKEREK